MVFVSSSNKAVPSDASAGNSNKIKVYSSNFVGPLKPNEVRVDAPTNTQSSGVSNINPITTPNTNILTSKVTYGHGRVSSILTPTTAASLNSQTAIDVKPYVTSVPPPTEQRSTINSFISNIRSDINKNQQKQQNVITQQTQNLQTGTRTRSLYGGTTQQYQNAYSNQEIIDLAKSGNISEQAAINVLAQRGLSEKELNKISDQIRLSKTETIAPLIVGAGLATGVVGAGIAATGVVGAAAVTGAGYIGGGLAAYSTGKSLYTSYKTGTLNAGRVASIILPQALFIGGASLGSGITGKAISSQRLADVNEVLDRAGVIRIDNAVVTKDNQIDIMKIVNKVPDESKPELLQQIKGGNSIRESEYKIVASTSQDAKILDKVLPVRNVKVIEVVDSAGNVINRVALGKVEVGKGKNVYRENLLQIGSGIKTEGGNIVMENVGMRYPEGQGLKEVSKTIEVIKPNKVKYFNEEGALKRLTGSKSYSFEGSKITAPKGKQLSFKDLTEVATSENYKRYPSSSSKSAEIQRAVSLKQINALVGAEGIDTSFGFSEKEIKFLTEQGGGKSNKIPKPVEFTREPSTKSMKPYTYEDLTKTPKQVEQPKSQSNQILKQIENQEKTLSIPSSNPSFEILTKTSLKAGAKEVVSKVKYPKLISSPLSKSKINLTPKQSQSLSETSFNNAMGVDYKKLTKNVYRGGQTTINVNKGGRERNRTPSGTYNPSVQTPIITPKQINAVIQSQALIQSPKLKTPQAIRQISYNPFNPIPPNTFTSIPPLILPAIGGGGGNALYNKLTKRGRPRKPAYTASLAAAAFEVKPVNVTRKQYEALSNATYSGAETRPVLNIVDYDSKSVANKVKKLNI